MKSDFHVHSSFCDGEAPPEETVKHAIAVGLTSLGFSGHGYTPYDLRYCMKDADGYIAEIKRLKEKYCGIIQIYLGVEEDSRHIQSREDFDYVIGSCHYIERDGKIYPLDSNIDYFMRALELYENDAMKMCEDYYSHFVSYILKNKPTVIGHFDLVTKFEEKYTDLFLSNPSYPRVSERYTLEALRSGSFFEVNTGLMSRGFRTSPCPHENLLYLIYREGGRVVLTSDSHKPENLCAFFDETKRRLRDVGFKESYSLIDGRWQAVEL